MGAWIQTRCGQKFDLENPDPQSISPQTLCVILARICRFGGHCKPFYSVAQHSLFVCDLVPSLTLKLPALLHDAHEAYWGFGDVCRPAKHITPTIRAELKSLADRVDLAIAKRFGFSVEWFRHPDIKHADDVSLATEKRDLLECEPEPWVELPPPHFDLIEPWDTDEAYRRFQSRLYELWGE